MRSRVARRGLALVLPGLLALGALSPAGAVNADHGDRVVSDDPAEITPHAMDGSVDALTRVGNRIIAAGSFSSVSPAGTFWDTSDDVERNGIFAFDANTGAIDRSFDPDLGGSRPAVNSLDTDGTHIYLAGVFRGVGGDSSVRRVAKLTPGGAPAPGFDAVPNAKVTEVVVRGSRVYIGGQFTAVTSGGVTRTRRGLAALNPSNGKVRGGVDVPFTGVYNPNTRNGGGKTSIVRMDVSPNGSRLVAIGNFRRVGGQLRPQVAVLDTRPRRAARVAPWQTKRFGLAQSNCLPIFDSFLRDVDFSPDGAYFVITTTGAWRGGPEAGVLCDTVTRWETFGGGSKPTWVDYTGGDTTYGVAVTGSAVYIGGHQRWLNNPFRADRSGPGAVPREGIAALDPVNGLPLSWNPSRTRGVGAQALFATESGLWVGSDTEVLGGERHGRIGYLPLAGGTRVPADARATLPDDAFVAKPQGVLQRRPLRRFGVPAGQNSLVDGNADWGNLRGGFLIDDTMYYGRADGGFYKRGFDPDTGAVGNQQAVDLRDSLDNGQRIPFPIASVSGMFYDPNTHRLYYTRKGNRRLFYRYFTPESEVVGAQTFTAKRNGVGFAGARGMTLASGMLIYGSESGKLRKVRFAGGGVQSKPRQLAGGKWRSRAIMVPDR